MAKSFLATGPGVERQRFVSAGRGSPPAWYTLGSIGPRAPKERPGPIEETLGSPGL
jgi:hypothetical protein